MVQMALIRENPLMSQQVRQHSEDTYLTTFQKLKENQSIQLLTQQIFESANIHEESWQLHQLRYNSIIHLHSKLEKNRNSGAKPDAIRSIKSVPNISLRQLT